MLEIQNLSVTVQDESGTANILKDVSLTVEDRKFIVITGPNGGGKTTLARAIMGLVPRHRRLHPVERHRAGGQAH